MMMGAAADNTRAASERVVAITVLSQLVRSAEVLDRIARALALCNLMPMLSYSWLDAWLASMPLAFRLSTGKIAERVSSDEAADCKCCERAASDGAAGCAEPSKA